MFGLVDAVDWFLVVDKLFVDCYNAGLFALHHQKDIKRIRSLDQYAPYRPISFYV